MKIKILDGARTIIENPHSRHGYFGWPSIARLQSGALAVVCSGYRCDHVCPFGKLVMALSFDDGKTYTGAFPLIDTPLDDRDGGIAVFGDQGVIVTSFNNTVAAQRGWNPLPTDSQDPNYKRNQFFNAYLDTVAPEDEERYLGAEFRLSFDGGKTFGPIFRSPVTSPHGPAVLPDGTLLWVGRTFSEDDRFRADSGVLAYRIQPDGRMDYVGRIPAVSCGHEKTDLCEPHVLPLPDGRLICHLRSEGGIPFTLFQSESPDSGRTWSEPRQLLAANGGAPAHLTLHSSGTLLSVYGYRQTPYGILGMASDDLGQTWESEFRLWEGVSGDLGYPCSVELADGSLLTVFYAKDTPEGPAVIKQIHWAIET